MKRFQVIKQLIAAKGTEYSISVETDKNYKRVTGICMYSDPVYSNNVNVLFTSPLKIDNREIFPENFDSALLFPVEDNKVFTKIDEKADGSKIEVSVIDNNNAFAAHYLTIVLQLENDDEKN
ncbi:hypothetical protein SDC9_53748 [bioreactor metagenome]|uniref:Uncharacterized protein n=1 Tax=bioreactor metagenome TaxID=1076179 RepID=A0A644WUE3_9ZZZZ